MLLNSNSLKGKCPICGAPNCACGGPSKVVPVDKVGSADGGQLRPYPIGNGAFIRLTDEAARARGLLAEEKRRDWAPNKMRRGSLNKSVEQGRR